MAAAGRGDPPRRICYPVVKRIFNLTEGPVEAWEVLSRYGETSNFGKVYETCLKGDCAYVLKYIPFTKVVKLANVEREIHYTKIAAEMGVGPPVYDAWTCASGGAMVQYQVKATLRTFLRILKTTNRTWIVRSVFRLLNKFHNKGYYHGDAHANNVMVDYNTASKKVRVYLIDFGTAGDLPADPRLRKEYITADYEVLIDGLKVLLRPEELLPLPE